MNFNMQKLMNFNTIVDDTNGARNFRSGSSSLGIMKFFELYLTFVDAQDFTSH